MVQYLSDLPSGGDPETARLADDALDRITVYFGAGAPFFPKTSYWLSREIYLQLMGANNETPLVHDLNYSDGSISWPPRQSRAQIAIERRLPRWAKRLLSKWRNAIFRRNLLKIMNHR